MSDHTSEREDVREAFEQLAEAFDDLPVNESDRDALARIQAHVEALEGALAELLTEVMDEDACYVEGGAQQLDKVAWRIARQFEDALPESLRIYLAGEPKDANQVNDWDRGFRAGWEAHKANAGESEAPTTCPNNCAWSQTLQETRRMYVKDGRLTECEWPGHTVPTTCPTCGEDWHNGTGAFDCPDPWHTVPTHPMCPHVPMSMECLNYHRENPTPAGHSWQSGHTVPTGTAPTPGLGMVSTDTTDLYPGVPTGTDTAGAT